MKADKIYLVGFMAAGKTTVARALARRLDWQAVDIDELIEQREHLTVSEIFAKRGEAHFRGNLPSKTIQKIAEVPVERAEDRFLLHNSKRPLSFSTNPRLRRSKCTPLAGSA